MKSLILNVLVFVRFRTSRLFKLQYLLESLIAKYSNGKMFSNELREIYKKKYDIHIGHGSYGGCFSTQNIPSGVTFGNYCSIAPNIRIFRANHPKDSFTTHPLLYNPVVGYVSKDMLYRPKLTIGHDVWIGEWVIILPSVNQIGNGAIIGAGAVVAKDVAPYSIVAGNPAKLIRMRFSNDTIKRIEETEWWALKKDELVQKIEYLNGLIDAGEVSNG
jgi:acetyltransferase-like isoleucine patch superfamily enzyme